MIMCRCEQVLHRSGAVGFAIFACVGISACGETQAQKDERFREAVAHEVAREENGMIFDRSSPSKVLATPPTEPIPEALYQPPIVSGSAITGESPSITDQFERDQMRRDIDKLKSQAELEKMNRQIERSQEQQRLAQKDREHALGLDHP